MDGPAANHNQYRSFKSGTPSFDTIVANLKEVCGLTRIALHGNYDQDNYRSFPDLLDDLPALGLGKVDCQKDYLDATLGELLLQQLRYPAT